MPAKIIKIGRQCQSVKDRSCCMKAAVRRASDVIRKVDI